MTQPRVRLNSATIARLLNSPKMRNIVNGAAKQMQSAAGGADKSRYFAYKSDRNSAAVTVRADDQAREGRLTRAAGRLGLEVKGS